jgi:hypothetical protein
VSPWNTPFSVEVTDPGFGHVHRAHGGPSGVDFYAVYILPPGSPNHLIAADPPEECA